MVNGIGVARRLPGVLRRQENRLLWLVPILLAGAAIPGGDSKSDAAPKAAYSPATPGAALAVSCWCTPTVKKVTIVPSAFAVQPGSVFELRARLYDADGVEIPEFHGYTPHWTITAQANVKVVSRVGHTVVLEIPDDISVSNFEIIAEADVSPSAVSSPAEAVVIPAAPTSSDYVVADRRTDGKSLSVALAASPSWDVNPVAFSGFGALGNLTKPGGVMVFSPDHAMAFHTTGLFTTSIDEFDYRSGGATSPSSPLRKDVTVWIDPAVAEDQWAATSADAMARLHLADANQTLLRNRTGVQFNLRAIHHLTTAVPGSNCSAWGKAVKGVPLAGGAEVTFDDGGNTNAIDIFVIDLTIETAFACFENGDALAPGYRIFLNGAVTVPRVLGHELGHVLLKTSGQDHIDAESIGASNLMIDACNDHCEVAPQKTHVSLGQACNMNVSNVIKALRPPSLPTPTVCPPIKKDVP